MYIRSYQTTRVRAKCAKDTSFLDKEKNDVLITFANECLLPDCLGQVTRKAIKG